MDIVKSALAHQENSEKEEEITSNDESDGMSDISEGNSKWCYIPDSILLNIFQYLTPKELITAGEVCISWHRVSYDGLLWKDLFYQAYEIDPVVGMMPGKTSWFEEFKRLTYHIPFIQTEELFRHNREVLHVSFSHNGEMFATCSRDGCIFVWESQYPVKIKYQYNMKSFRWESTQFSQFNSSDTLLLVSGAHFAVSGSRRSLPGEIAVFSLTPDFNLRCRVANNPFDILGTWYSEHYLLSGSLHWLDIELSTSVLWLSKANQELSSENIPIITQLFRFCNGHRSAVRTIMIANCLTSEVQEDQTSEEVEDEEATLHASCELQSSTLEDIFMNCIKRNDCFQYINPLQYNQEYNSQQHKENIQSTDIEENNVDEVANSCEKYLIFTTASQTCVPHQVAFKRIKNVEFPTSIYPGRLYTLKERRRDRKLEKERERQNSNAVLDFDAIADKFDKVDHVIDLHGHIVGMRLSPDHRYLYVNIRLWPKGAIAKMPPSPIAREIDIRVIDLMTLKEVGCMSRVHTAYVNENTECSDIFLDVCDEYVASGAEDEHGYLWDRYYGVSLAKFHHSDTVNSIAFNPRDPEMLVTTSDDCTVKIWRSRSVVHKLGLVQSVVQTARSNNPSYKPRGFLRFLR
ncbi:F-box and WD repeat domain containing 5 [Halictus rubicundus]|uniref:F-box and WD repeat domain containing 5 n=1 Tax=Halictus rubicundus TaxID=77578 RepID=UPI00403662EC